MKSPMLKAELLIRNESKKELTEALRHIGLVHLENLGEGQNLVNHQLWKEWLELKAWLDQLPELDSAPNSEAAEGKLLEALKVFRQDWGKWQHKKEIVAESQEFWQHWGGFEASKWTALESIGLKLNLYIANKREWENYKELTHLLKTEDQQVYFYHIGSPGSAEEINLDPERWPQIQANDIEQESKALQKEESFLHSKLAWFRNHINDLEKEALDIKEEWEFNEGLKLWSQQKDIPLASIKAWLPTREEQSFREACAHLPIAYRLSKPTKEDQVPVELKNSRYSRLFEPITKIFQLPHYFEFDLTPLIAVFYPILFAYCLGDAGYGAIMTLAVIIGWFTFLKKQRALAALVGILGISTTIMGLIKSGSLFGVPLSVESDNRLLASLGELVIIPDDGDYFFNAFNVALLIGVLQILIGISIAIAKAWYYEGFKESLSLWGKLLIVIASVALFMSDTLGLEEIHRLMLVSSLIGGIVLIMLFHDLSQGLFLRIGSSILPLFFIFTGLLGDVLSYVRLFALGVTSAVLGLVVNQIGMNMVSENWWSWIGVAAFLLFGHGLNFVLAALGSFIHPLRLTFVEFYNNAQFEGGGKTFQAFKKN